MKTRARSLFAATASLLILCAPLAVRPVSGQVLPGYEPPPPPTYTPISPGDPLKSLAHWKVQWLIVKKGAEERWIRSLRRRMEGSDDPAAYQKEIAGFQAAIAQDDNEAGALSGLDAFDPTTNRAAKANAAMVKANVEAWIKTLNSISQNPKTPDKEKKEANANIINLSGALSGAEKMYPNLF